jgi:hypothetical protein
VHRPGVAVHRRLRPARRRDRARASGLPTASCGASPRWRGSSRISWPTSPTTSRPPRPDPHVQRDPRDEPRPR